MYKGQRLTSISLVVMVFVSYSYDDSGRLSHIPDRINDIEMDLGYDPATITITESK